MSGLFNALANNAVPLLLTGIFGAAVLMVAAPLAPSLILPAAAFLAAHSPLINAIGLTMLGCVAARKVAPSFFPAPNR